MNYLKHKLTNKPVLSYKLNPFVGIETDNDETGLIS